MDQGNPNPKKFYVCSYYSPRTEFSTFQEALDYFNSPSYPYNLMFIEHKGVVEVVKRKKGTNVIISRFCI